jgi:hypothetical protein
MGEKGARGRLCILLKITLKSWDYKHCQRFKKNISRKVFKTGKIWNL